MLYNNPSDEFSAHSQQPNAPRDENVTQNSATHDGVRTATSNVAGENATAHGSDHIAELRALLGDDVVFVPVIRGEKRPLISGWQNLKLEDTQSPEYLEQLRDNNIGVVLGKASGGLCAIDIDDDDAVEPFLIDNPRFRDTFRSRGSRGAQLWVRVKGEYPKLTKFEGWGELRTDGGQSVIFGLHPNGQNYEIQNQAAPIAISFDQIKWPEHLHLPWAKTEYDLLVEEHGEPFQVSEKGGVVLNQLFFVRKYVQEHHILFDSSLGDFFEYEHSSGLWKRQTAETIKRSFLAEITVAAKKTHLSALYFKRTDATANGLAALLRAEVEKHDAFSNRPTAIHVANGMICFEGDEVVLNSFHPDYLSRNACPFAFDPEAECPRFKKELLESALPGDDVSLAQRWCGSVLLARNDAQRFLLFLGTPNGGKSTAMNILERTIGLQNVAQMRTDHLSDRFELSGFVGKTLLTGKDVAADFLQKKGAHVLKALVGHDLMEAEKKGFNQRVQIRGDFNVGVTCNTDLNIRLEGDVGAWRRRLLILKYERPAPTKRVADFADQLLNEEGPGILRWMVDGAITLTREIREVGDYKLSLTQRLRIDRLLDQSDSVRKFVNERVSVLPGSDVTTKEITASYYDYCDAKGWHPLAPNEVRAQLPQAILEVHRTTARNDIERQGKAQRGYKNLTVQEEVL